ncbi:type III-B CRISPR module-associated protein Cmr5 [Thermococcus waiotapuensis]|uniref:CRISPR type III-B/RAMP module-associated protein Cmr5 n=1 Tax=Thermococcus waiotapuensis TaxID=90909 RepID=A0AAE4NY38_9EURY|nr:type III-B CRISPR module-associated protein Cmr5 [Thermococcus waiotapuensis]MDV3104837.1 type III-B CRISPR module-associated protein Cmr5 [Thermococcus waiotapuensis]
MDLKSLEQERAEFAYGKISEVKGESSDVQKKYSSYVRSAPVLILTNGLGQALAFYLSRLENLKDVDYRSISPKGFEKAEKKAYAYLYKHIAEWLAEKRNLTKGNDPLRYYMKSNGIEAMILTDEAIALLNWLKRFAEAMLEKEENGE